MGNLLASRPADASLANRSPEIELLLLCARPSSDPDRAKQILNDLHESLDWEALVQLAHKLGLEIQLYSNLKTYGPDLVPETVLHPLRTTYYVSAQHSSFLTNTLFNLLDLFQAHNIEAIPFKGPTLATHIYETTELRPFGDLDFLVTRDDAYKAKDLLRGLGYEIKEAGWEFHATRGDRKVNVDVHRNFTPGYFVFNLTMEQIRPRLMPLSLAGRTILQPSPEDLLLILCVNLTKSGWPSKLRYVTDIAHLLRVQEDMDWGYVLRVSESTGVRRILFLGLSLAIELLGASPPKHIRELIETDPVALKLASEVQRRLFSQTPWNQSDKFLYFLRLRERWVRHYVIPLLWWIGRSFMVINERDREFVDLPRSMFFLYYLLKPVRLIAKYGLGIKPRTE